ncbi:MAG: apolipoprotein N-acyltransferase [Leptospira sp.]|nr:apolipoprotein N-acyltransferase [Leptospira sp.]
MNRYNLLYLLLSSLFLSLSLEPVGSALCGILSIALLFHVFLKFYSSPKLSYAFLYTAWYSFFLSVSTFYWVYWGILNITGLSGISAGLLFLLFALTSFYKLIIPFIVLLLIKKYKKDAKLNDLILLLIGTLSLTELCPMIFPLYFGDLLRNNLILRQIAVFGVEALSLSLIILSASIYLGFLHRKNSLKSILLKLIPCSVILTLNLVLLTKEIPTDFEINMGLIQTNTEYSKKLDREDSKYLTHALQTFYQLGMEAYLSSEQPIDLLVFPESAVPFLGTLKSENQRSSTYSSSFEEVVINLAKNLKSNILFNEIISDGNTQNSATLKRFDSEVFERRPKQILLPFGEYIPFESSLPFLRNIFKETSNHKPGSDNSYFTAKSKSNETFHFQTLICYEILNSNFVREKSYDPNIQFLLNLTNDSWFLSERESNLHAGAGRLRAIETGLPLVRLAVTGTTKGFDPWGRDLLGELPSNQKLIAFLHLPLQVKKEPTPFLRFGPWPLRSFAIFMLIFGFLRSGRQISSDGNEK